MMKEFKVGDFVYFEEDTGPMCDHGAMKGYGTIESFTTDADEEDLFFDESLENAVAIVKKYIRFKGKFS